jgi:hypothetical protein
MTAVFNDVFKTCSNSLEAISASSMKLIRRHPKRREFVLNKFISV